MEEGEGREKEGLGKTTELNDLLKSLKTNKYDCEIQMNSKKKKKIILKLYPSTVYCA